MSKEIKLLDVNLQRFSDEPTGVRTISGHNVTLEVFFHDASGGLVQDYLPVGVEPVVDGDGKIPGYPSSNWDVANRLVKFAFLFQGGSHVVSYQIDKNASVDGTYLLGSPDSIVSSAGVDAPITGDTELVVDSSEPENFIKIRINLK